MLFLLILMSSCQLSQQKVYTSDFLAKVPVVDFTFADAQKPEIQYYLFKESTQTIAIELNETYQLSEAEKKLPTKILMHGFTSNVTSPWYKETKNEYFKKGNHNIIYIDWSIPANKNFLVSSANVKPVGEYIAEFLINLQVSPDQLHLIGHSLGSHLAGFVGKALQAKTGKKAFRITATDAGGPGFENAKPESRLDKNDASFVDVIHTDCAYYGICKPIGHVDFYVNGGRNQPGCPRLEEDDNCSHARSNYYFIESINTRNATGKAAQYKNGEILVGGDSQEVVFGDATPIEARGVFYLETNSKAPFLKTSVL